MRMHPNRGKIEAIDVDEDIILVDVEKDEEVVAMDVEPQGRINHEDVNAASKGVSAIEPTIFDDEEAYPALQAPHNLRSLIMSSDEASFEVTYTSISSEYEEPSDASSPRAIVYRYNELPMRPPLLDYVPGLEEPEQAPPSTVYVLYVSDPKYPEYLVVSDAEEPIEDQPLPDDASPTALSPGYVADFDLEEDLKEDHADYLANGGDDDDDDDDDDESSRDDADDKDEEAFEEDKEEEEEHLTLADFTAAASLAVDHVPFFKETKLFETDESAATPPLPHAYPTTTRMSDRSQTPIPFPSKAEAILPPQKRLFLTAPTPRFEVDESSTAAAARQPGWKMASRRGSKTRTRTATTTATITDTTPMIDAAIRALIAQGVADALAEQTIQRNTNGDESQGSRSSITRPTSIECKRMILEESDEIEKYVGGLPDMIHGSVMASKPKTMHDAIEFATEQMDKKIRTLIER
nr:hypothetical protein [Tanacetum cinerariifolium]